MKNGFGMEIPEIKDIFDGVVVATHIEKSLTYILTELGFGSNASDITERIIEEGTKYGKLDEYESVVHQFLKAEGVIAKFLEGFSGRADFFYPKIKDYIVGSKVCDVGCGDGSIGQKVTGGGFEVTLVDVYKHPNIDALVETSGLSFVEYHERENIPLPDNEYDTTLSLMVYHHSDDPILLIENAKRITRKGGRALVIETVHGINPTDKEHEEHELDFVNLTHERQRLSNIFFDHFFNRIYGFSDNPEQKINAPYNFNTPANWRGIFEANGMKQEAVVYLGLDLKINPQYHTLHVLRVEK